MKATFQHSGVYAESESLFPSDQAGEHHIKWSTSWPRRVPGRFERGMRKVADVVAWMVSSRRELVRLNLSEGECEQDRLPYGSTERAVYVRPLGGARWWHFAVYRHASQGDGQGCIDVRLLGWVIEVWFHEKGNISAA